MKKELRIVTPAIRAYLRHAFPLSIIGELAFKSGWIFSKYIYVEYNRDNLLNCYLNYKYYDFFKEDGVFIRHYWLFPFDKCRSKIIDFFKEIINADTYVFSEWNEKVIEGKEAYQKKFFPHACLLYGYDDKKEVFMTEGYLSDAWKWEKHEVPFLDLSLALLPEKNNKDHLWCDAFKVNPDYFWEFNFEKMLDEFRHFLDCSRDVEGINGMRFFVSDIGLWVAQGLLVPRPSMFLLVEHAILMEKRLHYLMKYGYVSYNSSVLYSFEKLVKRIKIIQGVVIKYNIIIDKKLGEKIQYELLDVINCEEQILRQVFRKII